jgi:hypothetical protein
MGNAGAEQMQFLSAAMKSPTAKAALLGSSLRRIGLSNGLT